jgi:hypothetical protein
MFDQLITLSTLSPEIFYACVLGLVVVACPLIVLR